MCVCVCVCQAHEKMKRKTEVVWPPTSGVWSICPLAHVLKCVHGFTDSTTFMWLMNVLHLINDVYCFVASLMGCCLLGKLQRRWRVSMMVNCSCSTHTQLVPVKPVKWGVRNAVHCCLFFLLLSLCLTFAQKPTSHHWICLACHKCATYISSSQQKCIRWWMKHQETAQEELREWVKKIIRH